MKVRRVVVVDCDFLSRRQLVPRVLGLCFGGACDGLERAYLRVREETI